MRQHLVLRRRTLQRWMIKMYNMRLLFLTFHPDKTKKMLRFLFRAILLRNLRRVASVGGQALTYFGILLVGIALPRTRSALYGSKGIAGHQEFTTSEDVPDASKLCKAVVLEMPAEPKIGPHSL